MTSFLRFVMLLSLGVWIGGLLFLPIVAQIAFSMLPTHDLAGLVVRDSLLALHRMGMTSGVVFLLGSFVYERATSGEFRAFQLSHIIVVLMLALTAVSQISIIPHMDALRASAGELSSLPANDPIRRQFDFLHASSTRAEEGVLLLGLSLLYLTSRRLARRA